MAKLSRANFDQLYEERIIDNHEGSITPEDVRKVFDDLSDSVIWHDEAASGPAGPSAYEVATNAGFVGSETEWLMSLVGPKGEPGEPGPAGVDGRPVTSVRAVAETAYTLGGADDGAALIFATGAASTVTLPDDASVGLRAGTVVYVLQADDHPVSVAGAPGVALDLYEGVRPVTRGRSALLCALKLGPNRWRLSGDLAFDSGAVVMPDGGSMRGFRSTAATVVALTVEDTGSCVELVAADPVTVILPTDASAAISQGAVIHLLQTGTGAVTLQPEDGAIMRYCKKYSAHIADQCGVVRALKIAPNTWHLTGDLSDLRSFA